MLSKLKFTAALFATALIGLLLICALPHDRYIRFQALTDQAVVKAGWIYERIHFDPKPIDVVFIGTSHVMVGVDSVKTEQACRAQGGRHCASVNFAMEHMGRDLHWLLIREVLETRKPKLLVVEVMETEPRSMHPVFGYLADMPDLASAPLLINTSYVSNLVHLPLRQLSLFAQSLDPALFGMRRTFDSSHYRGAHWDDTYAEAGSLDHPVIPAIPRTAGRSVAELEYQRAHPQTNEGAGPKLPRPLKPYEYQAPFFYLDKITALARQKGVPIRFAYMPKFRAQPAPDFEKAYLADGAVYYMPRTINNDPKLWFDIGHLNFAGASQFSSWLGAQIAGEQALK